MKKEKTIKGFKGFNKDLTCNGFQYKEGETFEMEGIPERCERGFHFCTEPLDVFRYYGPGCSVFHFVEGFGKGSTDNKDSKIAVSKIKIGAEISLAEFIKLSFKAILKRCKKGKTLKHTTGYRSASSATGDRSASSATGDRSASSATGDSSASSATGYSSASSATGYSSASSATGYRSASSATGYSSASLTTGQESKSEIVNTKDFVSNNAVAIGIGYQNIAKAPLGCWIVLSEHDEDYNIKSIKSAKIDGKKILADTWYKIVNGKFIRV
jgi:hypothetical protein